MSNLNHLPVEVAHLIVVNLGGQHDLYQAALINKQFYMAVNPILWRAPAKKDPRRRGFSAMASTVLKSLRLSRAEDRPYATIQGNNIRTLHFGRGDQVKDISRLFTFTPLLEDIKFQSTRISDNHLENMVRLCSQLIKVTCYRLPKITDHSIIFLGQNCLQLRDLTLNRITSLSPTCLPYFERLERLSLVGSVGMRQVSTATHLRRFQYLTDLTTPSWLRTDFLRELLPMERDGGAIPLDTLVSFHMSGSYIARIEGDVLHSFIQAHPLLQELDLTWCDTNEALTATIADSLPHLTYLRLSQGSYVRGIRSKHVPFSDFYPNLQTLVLTNCYMDDGIGLPLHVCMPNLQHLDLSGSYIKPFTQDYPHLKTLCLQGCYFNRPIFGVNAPMPELENVDLSNCRDFTYFQLLQLVDNAIQLTSVRLKGHGIWAGNLPQLDDRTTMLHRLDQQVINIIRNRG